MEHFFESAARTCDFHKLALRKKIESFCENEGPMTSLQALAVYTRAHTKLGQDHLVV